MTISSPPPLDNEYSEYEDVTNILSPSDQIAFSHLREGTQLMQRLGDGYLECKRINANIKALRIQTKKELEMHAKTFQFYEKYLTRVFAERGQALSQHYRVLDRALSSNDREVIISCLQGIASIVTKNPLEDLANIARSLTDRSRPLELDF